MGRPLHLLIVEDNEADTELLLRALKRGGYEVTYTRVETPEAMQAALQDQTWEVITADHAMPHFSAPAALALAQALQPEVPFLIVSGEMDLNLAVSLMKAGAQDYIQKRELARVVPAIERELRDVESRRQRQQAEEALRESDELHRLTLENITDAVFITDDAGAFRYICPNVDIIFGYNSREVQALGNIARLLGEELFAPAALEALKEIRNIEREITDKAGTARTLLVTVQRVSIKGGTRLYTCRDITERKRTEAALRESEERYRLLVDLLPDIVFIHTAGKVAFINKQGARLMGASEPQALIGKPVLEMVHPGYRGLVQTRIQQQIGAGQPVPPAEEKFIRLDGTPLEVEVMVFPFTLQGRPAVLGIARDLTERKQAAAALRESEERYRSLFNNHHAVMLVVDPDTGDIVEANLAACRYYGYSLEALQRMKITDINILSADEVHRELERAKVGQKQHFIFHHRLADGAIRAVEVYSGPITIQGRQLLYSVIHDITERQCAEAALQESNERYQRITQAVTDYFYTVRIENGSAAETRHGPGCVAVTGYTSEEFAADPYLWFHMIVTEDRPLVEDQAQRVLTGRWTFPLEHRIIRKDGALRWVRNTPVLHCDEQGRLLSYDGLIQDITERKQVEEALTIKDRAIASAINGMAIAEFGGKLTYVNRSFLGLWGYETESEVLGKPAIDFWQSAEQASLVVETLTRQDVWFGELVAKKKDGSLFDAQVAANVVKDQAGQPLCMMSSFLDITEQKRAEVEIRQLNTALEQRVQERTAQLEATVKDLEAFSSSVSHDLRAPLRSIAGYGQALLEDHSAQLDEVGKQHLQHIGQAVQRMEALIAGLLELSRLGRSGLQRQSVDLSMLAWVITDELRQRAPGRSVKLVMAGDLTAHADPCLMQVVLENLLDNAWKFTSRQLEAQIEFGEFASPAGERVFFIRDNGAGFEMAYADRLFGPFQRLHAQAEYPGIGIGLATVRRIIERHGGRVWAEGAVNQGAIFYFTLA